MNNKEFYVLSRIKGICSSVDGICINIPKKEYVVRDRILSDCLDIMELVMYANYNRDKGIRVDCKYRILSKIGMLNFYLERIYKKGVLNKKDFDKLIREISELTKMIYGWIKDDDKV